MKKYFNILFILSSLLICQDRSTIFNTGSPSNLQEGYTISSSKSIANRIYVSNDYVLEAMAWYMSTTEENSGNINITIRIDENGIPGDIVNEAAFWEHAIDPSNLSGYNVLVTTDLCIYLDAGNYYWWTIEAGDDNTNVKWIYSDGNLYTYAAYDNDMWTSENGFAGAGGVWAEQVYDPPYNLGDVNSDFLTNVVDIVLIVGHILDTSILSEDVIEYADINSDATIDVVDLVQLVNIILSENSPNPSFSLIDINPESSFYGELIGTSFFNGQVSGYYFGKQG